MTTLDTSLGSPAIPPGSDGPPVHFGFENTYARLPDRFYSRLAPTPVATPHLVKLNVELARTLGLNPDALSSAQGVDILAGNSVAEGAEPLAQAYLRELCRLLAFLALNALETPFVTFSADAGAN